MFCPKCKTILYPEGDVSVCKKCGYKEDKGGAVITALRDVTCIAREGDRVALIGHNGAGKSTFLRLISGIYHHCQ